MKRRGWAILAGEYPPQVGGVADYTRQLARSLAQRGDSVHVFAPVDNRTPLRDAGVTVHTLPDLRRDGLSRLEDAISGLPEHEILLQYTPQSLDSIGINLPLCAWLTMRSRRRQRLSVMFHEVRMPIGRDQPWRYNLLGVGQALGAQWLAHAGDRLLISTSSWRRLLPGRRHVEVLPVPSNLPTTVDPARVRSLRAKTAPIGSLLVGHFGSYPPSIVSLLRMIIQDLLQVCGDCSVMLIGRGGEALRDELARSCRHAQHRILATGKLDETAAAEHLAACDMLVQPYPDGVTTRRSSLMAGLALGVCVVTNRGSLTEEIWDEQSVTMVPAAPDIPHAVKQLLSDSDLRMAVGRRGKLMYDQHFALHHTINKLRATDI